MQPIYILLIVVVLLGVFVLFLYNNLIALRNRVQEAWSDIDVQLKRRNALIPNLVESVKGYAKHEKTLLESVTKARTSLMNATTTEQKGRASNMISDALKSIFAVAENYPKLRANEN